MQFYSTHNPALRLSLREAVMTGLAPDGGLYMPDHFPVLPPSTMQHLSHLSTTEIAYQVLQPFIGDEVPDTVLQRIITEAFNFSIPLVKLEPDVGVLELWHGPTLAFKDVGARFMARLMGYFAEQAQQTLTVLVATSGDTGSAVAHGFYQVPNIRVVILYPHGRVSHVQEQQLTTLGDNISALSVQGSFDDCQRLVKQAFVDTDLKQHVQLTSANSINIARLLPQMLYYWLAYQQASENQPIIFSVPSGNFGNLTAGLMAKRMGLPVARFIAATNSNDVVPNYLQTGTFTSRPSVATISNAMDVGNPSNFVRLLELYHQAVKAIRQDVVGYRTTEDETRQVIAQIYHDHQYLFDPHSAVGYHALQQYRATKPAPHYGIVLATAHPAKFSEAIEPVIHAPVILPERLEQCLHLHNQASTLDNDFTQLKQYLLSFTTTAAPTTLPTGSSQN